MADAFTPNLQLVKAEIGASRDTWGAKLNANMDTLDSFVSSATPIGSVIDFAGPNPPPGWLVCDGRALSRTTYAALFAAIGTYWGAGDGSTTFNIPNTAGRSSVGPGTVIDQAGVSYGFSFTDQVGFLANYISQATLPNYQLYVDVQGYHSHTGATVGAGAHSHTTDAQGNHSHGGATAAENVQHNHYGTTDAGGQHAHDTGIGGQFAIVGSGGGGRGDSGGGFANASFTGNAGNHQHTFTTGVENQTHLHGIYADCSHAHNVYGVGDHVHGIYGDGSHSHNVWLNGSGQPFEVLSPVICFTKIIYAGAQTITRAANDIAPARQLRRTPMRGSR